MVERKSDLLAKINEHLRPLIVLEDIEKFMGEISNTKEELIDSYTQQLLNHRNPPNDELFSSTFTRSFSLTHRNFD